MSASGHRAEGARALYADSLNPAVNRVDEASVISRQITIGRPLLGQPVGSAANRGALPVRQVGPYRIVKKLGESAMATVYKAYGLGIDAPLVIKLLHAELCRDSECRMRFLREGKVALTLSHPNIVTVFEAGEIEGRPYIAMEWLDGVPLNEMLVDGRGLPLRDVLDIGIQLARALDYVHPRGIVHRDVKPGNMIRVRDSGTIKLADFGIAHTPFAGEADPVRTGPVMGTPHYMSPEQVIGDRLDARSDLWAVGVILYQLVSGKRPFEANTVAALLCRITNDSPKPVAELRADIPASLRRIIARCLEKPPKKRYQSARSLAGAIARVLREVDAA
jgi:serine/threonine-protein kinase